MLAFDLPSLRQSTATRIGLFSAVYIASAGIGHYLAFPRADYWPFWPPNGLLLGVLLVSERKFWPALLAATLPASLISDLIFEEFQAGLVHLAVAFWLANTLEPLLAAWILRRFVSDRLTLANTREFLALVAIGALLAPAVGATLGAISNSIALGKPSFVDSWLQWWIGDAIGVLIVAPVVITWNGAGQSPRIRRRPQAYFLEFALFCLVAAIVVERVFHRLPEQNTLAARFPFFLVMPLMLWAGLRFEPRGASLSVLLLGLIVIYYTTRGYGSIAQFGDSVMQQGLLLQGLLAQASCVTLLFSSSIERRELAEMRLQRESQSLERTEAEVRRQRDLLQSILDSIGEAVLVVDAMGEFVHFNPAARQLYGLDSESIPSDKLIDSYLFLADGVTPCQPHETPAMRALRGELCDGVPLVIRLSDASAPIYVRVTARPIRAVNGTIAGAVVVRSDITPLVLAEKEQAKLIEQLQQALREIKTLRGLIPICANCKKIRNDQGAWERLESYMSAHTEAEFTHGVCPECCPLVFGENWQQSLEDTVS